MRASGTAVGYTGWLVALMGPVVPVAGVLSRGRRLLVRARPVAVVGLAGGALSTAAYGLVLWAQSRAPLAPVAALRESSVVVGAVIGAWLFRERFGTPRVLASVLLAAGIGLMLLGGWAGRWAAPTPPDRWPGPRVGGEAVGGGG